MPIAITAFANCDDVVVFWKPDGPIADCLGFALERETKDKQGRTLRSYVENRTGFASHPGKPGEHRPSTEWPFQRFGWTDHAMDLGNVVRYRVTPVIRGAGGKLALASDGASDWTPFVELTGEAGDGFSFFFNRGLVISQFMSRYLNGLRKPGETLDDVLPRFKASLGDHETKIREFLSGELRKSMIGLLRKANAAKGHVYAALFELNDGELIGEIKAFGARAHVVLANGSVKKAGEDENAAARRELAAAHVEVHDRMVAPKALGHNKFLVTTDRTGKKAAVVLTGSTNWTTTGLCTQMNNALLVQDAAVAGEYLAQWNRLRDAGSAFPASLVDANDHPKHVRVKADVAADVWFTRTRGGVDLAALNAAVGAAKEGILFLMFMPGGTGVLKTVNDMRRNHPGLYVHGVVSTLPKPDEESSVNVSVVGQRGPAHEISLDVVQPEGIQHPFASWAAEVSRQSFLKQIGFAIVHSKVIVIDPFTDPVVITGSHNFSGTASKTNDENFVIVRGNAALAQGHAAHIMSVYQHYRWQTYVAEQQAAHKSPWSGLQEDPSWQNSYFRGAARREMEFWVNPHAVRHVLARQPVQVERVVTSAPQAPSNV